MQPRADWGNEAYERSSFGWYGNYWGRRYERVMVDRERRCVQIDKLVVADNRDVVIMWYVSLIRWACYRHDISVPKSHTLRYYRDDLRLLFGADKRPVDNSFFILVWIRQHMAILKYRSASVDNALHLSIAFRCVRGQRQNWTALRCIAIGPVWLPPATGHRPPATGYRPPNSATVTTSSTITRHNHQLIISKWLPNRAVPSTLQSTRPIDQSAASNRLQLIKCHHKLFDCQSPAKIGFSIGRNQL